MSQFDFEYVQRSFADFHRAVGQRDVMLSEERRVRAFHTLVYVCNNADVTPEERETVVSWLVCAFEDYTRRCVLVDIGLMSGALR